MAQFLLNAHHFPLPKDVAPSPAEFAAVTQQWQDYIGGIATQGKFIGTQRLAQSGKIIGPDGSVKEAVNDSQGLIVGTLTLDAADIDEAITLANSCPILSMGGSVEVRPVVPFEI